MQHIIDLFNSHIGVLLQGTLITILIAAFSSVLAMVFAIPTGLMRLSTIPLLRWIANVYVESIRGTPLFLQLYAVFFGVRIFLITQFNYNLDVKIHELFTALNSNSLLQSFPFKVGDNPISPSTLVFGVVALSFNYGAYLSEVVRAGVQAVDRGQAEAADSLGLSWFQKTRFIILPQALRLMIPPFTNYFITLVQDTSLLSAITLVELSQAVQLSITGNSGPADRWIFYIIELILYFAICYSLAIAARRTERRFAKAS
ncbi:MAG TPA: amino acid ABC transporter permease [Ktedonobacterales bacterium]|jgi:His/Glu/Gln/Arg/opine family amino acid ABC transporter permease subunit